MSQIDANSIFMLIIFVLPGFLAYSVCHSLYRQAVQVREIEVTYKSLLYSSEMYAVIFLVFEFAGRSLNDFIKTHPFLILSTMIVISVLWGIALFRFSSDDLLYKFLRRFKLVGVAQPPNLFAAILDPEYQPKANKGYWIVFKKDGQTYEGYVAFTDLKSNDRLAYVTELRELDHNGDAIVHYPDNFGMILDLTKIEGLEIIYCE